MMPQSQMFYVTGGSLTIDAPSYIVRRADTDLLEGICAGKLCYVLDCRQVGKSSLMVRCAESLRQRGYGVAVLDLSVSGKNLSVEQWYFGLLVSIGEQLGIEDELEAHWNTRHRLGCVNRLFECIRHEALERYGHKLVIFIDEIDAVASLDFSADELFAAIRACYNLRKNSDTPKDIQFCLIGVAAPSELISDARVTPFNIGTRIELSDFTFNEMRILQNGLPDKCSHLLDRVYYWTSGHPYLSQKLCAALVSTAASTIHDVDHCCTENFLRRGERFQEDNLALVQRRLLAYAQDTPEVLFQYSKIISNKQGFKYDPADRFVQALMLSGVVRIFSSAEGATVVVRNRIYSAVFDSAWIKGAMPDAEQKRQKAALRAGFIRASAIWITLLASLAIAWSQRELRERQAHSYRVEISQQKRTVDGLHHQILSFTEKLTDLKTQYQQSESVTVRTRSDRARLAREKVALLKSIASTEAKLQELNRAVTTAEVRRSTRK